jgi:TonB family protein
MKDKKILVVDFDEESLISLSNLVFEEGFQAVTAMDGLSGYEKFKAENFDLVMIEPMLPKLHGFELMKRINQDPARKTPIIVVTGIYREPSCKMEALQVYGASAYFTKPWNKDELRSKMLQLLVNGIESTAEKQETPAPPPAKTSSPPPAEDWGLLKAASTHREPKAAKHLDDIEKELLAAVSGISGTGRKKEPVKDAEKGKKETKPDVDGDIEALLKGAIGGLGLDEKKKKVEPARPESKRPSPPPAARFEPPPKPTPAPKIEPIAETIEKIEKKEKTPVAKEIKERIPPQPKTADNIPSPPPRVHFETEKTARGIDQALIEIDKIPLDTEKEAPETGRPVVEHQRIQAEEKKVYFDDYVEPAKKKPPVALIGGLAAALLIVAGSTFMVVKSKKPKAPASQNVSSLQPSLPSEFAQRQDEISVASGNRESALRSAPNSTLKPTPKKEASPPPAQQSDTETVVPIAPVLPEETPPLGLQLQTDPQIESSAQASREDVPQTKAPSQQAGSLPAETPPAKPAAKEPIRVTAKPGDLVSLDSVDIAPILLKRVDPKYPVQALNMGVGGTVTVNALISETGDVIRTEILKGIKGGFGLERAAESAIRQWQFKPAEKDGVPVRVWKPLDIVFKTNPPTNQ